ncbi:toll/interleukin-1 receptor domain-containing protein [Flexivirga meconopsidis]|uniref:toll/interleukin-1 receptor domain-containing protein n=1 Tax=Flexivirga meconopsidis TaxID=2977121 RepID=UPI00224039A5|nr:toll/interleukin-1 receptor domain-containing protein [Flexivirga meconopsidis]
MSPKSLELPPIQIFLSYAKEDDKNFHFIEPLRSTLSQLIVATTGRKAEIFLDRESIPLGENWQDKIENGVRSSLVFIAVYTAHYTQREACREEFLLFRDRATQLHVPGLLLPVVLLGFSSLLPEGDDEVSDYVRAHQAADFQQAWVDGTDSAEFRQVLLKLATRIIDVVAKNEDALASLEYAQADASLPDTESAKSSAPSSGSTQLDELEDEDDFLELTTQIGEQMELLTTDATNLGENLGSLGQIPPQPANLGSSPAVASKYFVRVAASLRDPSLKIEENGQSMLNHTREADRTLRRIVNLARASESEDFISTIYTQLDEGVGSLDGLPSVAQQLEDLLTAMKTPEALSATIRKSVRPARKGILNINDAIAILSTWREAIDTLKPASSE